MADCKDADGNRPVDVASLVLAPLLDPERLAALTLVTSERGVANSSVADWSKLLRDGGASLDAQDVRGVSPLIAAAVIGDVAAINAVLAAGATKPPAITMPKSGTSAAAWAQYASLEAMAALQAKGGRSGVADSRAASRLLEGSRSYSSDADALRVLAPLDPGPLPLYRPVAENGAVPASAHGILSRFATKPAAALRASPPIAQDRPDTSALDFLAALQTPIAVVVSGDDADGGALVTTDDKHEFHGEPWARVARAAAFFAQCRIASGKSALSPAV